MVQELDAAQRDTRSAATEAFKLRAVVEEANEQVMNKFVKAINTRFFRWTSCVERTRHSRRN